MQQLGNFRLNKLRLKLKSSSEAILLKNPTDISLKMSEQVRQCPLITWCL